MGYLPIFLDLEHRPCVVIGGSESALAKVQVLLEAGAIVTVVGSVAADGIKWLAEAGKIRHLAREYEYGDVSGHALAYVATTNAEVARRAANEAREICVPLNVVDNPESSTFISAATFRRGGLQIAISTGGSSPAVARIIRQRLEEQFGPDYAVVLEIMRGARRFLAIREPDQRARARALKSLAGALLNSVGRLEYSVIDGALRLHLQAGIAELGLDPQACAMTSNAAQPRDD